MEKYADEVKVMKRELPKNVRQIGNVSDSSKIYVEDYVDTYFNQLCEKADQALMGAFLIGEIVQEGEEDYIYIYGAIQMSELQQKGKDIVVTENTWKEACETSKKYFGNAEILGWFLVSPNLVLEENQNLLKIHQNWFAKKKSILVLKESREREEKYFIHKFRNLMESQGHYIYYEKNNEMQDYMIASRKQSGIAPSEVIEDSAIKSFRSVIQDKMEKKEKRENSRLIYTWSLGVILILLVMGITRLNDFGRMNAWKDTIATIFEKNEVETEQEEPENVPVIGEVVSNTDPSEVEEQEPEVESNDDVVQGEKEEQPELPNGDGVYFVEKGDTLAIISRKVYGDLDHIDAICRMNGLKNGNLILVGQKLLLP